MSAARKLVKPRFGRRVTVGDLRRLETSQATHYLYCGKCGGSYSADPRDYWHCAADTVMKCCRVNNVLLERGLK